MRPGPRTSDAGDDPALPTRRRVNRRSLAIVLALHGLLAIALLNWSPSWPTLSMGGSGAHVAFLRLPKPPPPAPKIPKPAASGAKLAPPPNLASTDVTASTAGAPGTRRAPAGAGRLFEDCADTPDRAMVADVYRLPRGTASVGAMRALKPIKRVCLANLTMAPRKFHEGFPGMAGPVEWFGLDIRFTVNIAEAGPRDFVLLAEDGAILSIDDVDVIDNDGLHQPVPKVARVNLAAGLRRFRVRYFQGPGEAMSLLLGWKKAREMAFNYIPPGLMGRPTGPVPLR